MTLTFRLWRKCRRFVSTWGMAPERDDPSLDPFKREVRLANEARDTRRKSAANAAIYEARHAAMRRIYGSMAQ